MTGDKLKNMYHGARTKSRPSLSGLNEQAISHLTTEFQRVLLRNPEADLGPLFEKHAQKYMQRRARRTAVLDRTLRAGI